MTAPTLTRTYVAALILISVAALPQTSTAAEPLRTQLDEYARSAKADNAGFSGFSASRGETFFRATHAGGKPDTPSCTTCHGTNPRAAGRTRAGKGIAPMAVSVSPERYTDAKKVEKWFRRNCKSVLGRACTSLEKGDFLSFMTSQ